MQTHFSEKPLKDRSRRFHCSALYGDQATCADHDVSLFEYTQVRKLLHKLKCFLMGKVMLLMDQWNCLPDGPSDQSLLTEWPISFTRLVGGANVIAWH